MTQNLALLPGRIIAGESIWISAENTLGNSADIIIDQITPAGGYTLAYQFSSPTPISVSATANGASTGWTLLVTAAQTLAWRAGKIRYAGMATHTASGRVYSVDAGSIGVEASPVSTSQYAAALTAAEAALAAYATSNQRSFTLGPMSITYNSADELVKVIEFLRSEVARETSSRPRRLIRTRFT